MSDAYPVSPNRSQWLPLIWQCLDKARYSLNNALWLVQLSQWLLNDDNYANRENVTFSVEKEIKDVPVKLLILIQFEKVKEPAVK